MNPLPVYRHYLYTESSRFANPSVQDESLPPMDTLDFRLEPTFTGFYTYYCLRCRQVEGLNYFKTHEFRLKEDLSSIITDEMSQHAKAHQIIGAAERAHRRKS